MSCAVQYPFCVFKAMGQMQLIIILFIIVHLVLIGIIVIGSSRIQQILPFCSGQPIAIGVVVAVCRCSEDNTFGGTVPLLVGNFFPTECYPLEYGLFSNPSGAEIPRTKVRRGPVNVTIRPNARQTRFNKIFPFN